MRSSFCGLAILLTAAGSALATDRPVDRTRLVLSRPDAREKLVFVSKDPTFLSTGVPLAVPEGAVGIRVRAGSLRTCALFDVPTVRRDQPGRFVASGALAAAVPDCRDTTLGFLPSGSGDRLADPTARTVR
jgi:hypothetical protein